MVKKIRGLGTDNVLREVVVGHGLWTFREVRFHGAHVKAFNHAQDVADYIEQECAGEQQQPQIASPRRCAASA